MMKQINFRLLSTALIVNFCSLSAGIAYTWTSPVLPKLKDKATSPFGRSVSSFEESWITSLISLGASIGPIFCGLLVNRIGRKKTFFILSLPIISSYLILAFANKVELFYFSRFLLGIGIGCVYSLLPIYIGEISETRIRGTLGCIMSMGVASGTIFTNAIGPFVSVKIFCLICLAPQLIFLGLFIFVPESPYYLVKCNKEDEAKTVLKNLRTDKDTIEKELEQIKVLHSQGTSSIRNMLKSKSAVGALLIGAGLLFFQQFSGISVYGSYLQSILKSSGSVIPSEISAVFVGVVQVITSVVASQLIERLGRKLLIITSLSGMCISEILLGLYFFLKIHNYEDAVNFLYWLPTASLILCTIMYNVGMGSAVWALIGELFAPNFKSIASTFCTVLCLFSAFFVTNLFAILVNIVGSDVMFWSFSVFCALGVVFVVRVMQETKGKSFQEIQQMFEKA